MKKYYFSFLQTNKQHISSKIEFLYKQNKIFFSCTILFLVLLKYPKKYLCEILVIKRLAHLLNVEKKISCAYLRQFDKIIFSLMSSKEKGFEAAFSQNSNGKSKYSKIYFKTYGNRKYFKK